jgi:hypothetical protein
MGDRLGRSEKTFSASSGQGRAQAIVHARDAGFGSKIVR